MTGAAVALAWWLVALPMRQLPGAVLDRGRAQPPLDSSTAGFERVMVRTALSPRIVQIARTLLDLPLGSERPVVLDGRRYLFVLEWHYHPRGFIGAPNGWHKGVTVYELVAPAGA